jgi:hypothetical protein
MNITCKCGNEYRSRMVPCPEGIEGCLVLHYAKDAHVCPKCGTDNTPKLSDGVHIEVGMGVGNLGSIKRLDLYRKAPIDKSLLDIPAREDPVEICEVCGAEFQGLYHCQSIKNIRPIKWSARETVGIGIIDPERVQKDAEGRTVLVPTSVTGTMKISRFAVSKGQMNELLGVDPESWPDNVEDMDEWEEE